jgi:hypothetical protein
VGGCSHEILIFPYRFPKLKRVYRGNGLSYQFVGYTVHGIQTKTCTGVGSKKFYGPHRDFWFLDFSRLCLHDEYEAHFAFLPKCGVEPAVQFVSDNQLWRRFVPPIGKNDISSRLDHRSGLRESTRLDDMPIKLLIDPTSVPYISPQSCLRS